MNIVYEQQNAAKEDQKPEYFGRVKLLDMITRIVPSAFFLLAVLLKFYSGHILCGPGHLFSASESLYD